jgi:hypothetical protein
MFVEEIYIFTLFCQIVLWSKSCWNKDFRRSKQISGLNKCLVNIVLGQILVIKVIQGGKKIRGQNICGSKFLESQVFWGLIFVLIKILFCSNVLVVKITGTKKRLLNVSEKANINLIKIKIQSL